MLLRTAVTPKMTLPFAYTGSDMQKHSKLIVSAFSIDKFKKAWKT